MQDHKKRILFAIGLGVVMIAAMAGILRLSGSAPVSDGGTASALGVQMFKDRPPAPDFLLTSINGRKIRLSDLQGKVVLLNFFATWCGPCRWEMPEMNAVYQNFRDQGFVVVAVSIDTTADPLPRFAGSMNLTYPVVHDPGMQVARRYGFRGPPLSYLIDRQGRIAGGAFGPRKWNGALAQILVRELLAEPAA